MLLVVGVEVSMVGDGGMAWITVKGVLCCLSSCVDVSVLPKPLLALNVVERVCDVVRVGVLIMLNINCATLSPGLIVYGLSLLLKSSAVMFPV